MHDALVVDLLSQILDDLQLLVDVDLELVLLAFVALAILLYIPHLLGHVLDHQIVLLLLLVR